MNPAVNEEKWGHVAYAADYVGVLWFDTDDWVALIPWGSSSGTDGGG